MDKQTVIDNLEQNIRWIEDFPVHQFPGWGNVTMAMRGAVEALQPAPVKPSWLQGRAYCGKCGHGLPMKHKETKHYCAQCGVKIDWERRAK